MDPSFANGSKLKVSQLGIREHTLAQFSAVSLCSSSKRLPTNDITVIYMIQWFVLIVLSVSAFIDFITHRLTWKLIEVTSIDLYCHSMGALIDVGKGALTCIVTVWAHAGFGGKTVP